ncbi:MAG: sec-independent protein translocase protein TatC [Planctomycetota bacterium]|jgi:sec-independent protein translocase protein TatC
MQGDQAMASKSDTGEEAEMSFGDHLEELRSRMIRAILSTFLGFIVVYSWHEEVLQFAVAPFTNIAHDLGLNSVLNVLGPTDAFFAYMKISFIVALMVSAPIWMWQFWAFIGAGLYSHEKRSVYKFAPPMVLLFVAGISFGYYILIPIGLRFLLAFADPSVLQNLISLSEYMSLFTTMTLILGLTFQLPVGMALLCKIGVVTPRTFREKRRYFILGAFFFGALLTPPDAVTQILLALPLILLFELGISCAWLVQGSGREPIDWDRWKKRGIVVVVVVIGLLVFGERLAQSYRERLVDQNIREAGADQEQGMPYFSVLNGPEGCAFLKYNVDRLMIVESGEDEELVIVGNGKKSNVLQFVFRDDRVTKMSVSDSDARFLVNTNARSVHVQEVGSQKGREFLGPFMLAFENSSSKSLSKLESLLFGLLGKQPAGTRPIVADDSDSDIEVIREAWVIWWKTEGKEWVYQP